MRILYHHRTLGDGAEGIHVAEMVRAFRELGHEVKVVSLIGERTNVATPRQRRWGRVRRLLPGAAYELAEIAYNLPGYAAIRRAIASFSPDFVYDRYVSYNYATVAAARHARIPVFLEVNSPYSYQKQTFDERLYLARTSRFFERTIASRATRVIVVSTPLKDFLSSIGVPAERIVVMPNGVDAAAFSADFDSSGIRASLGLTGKLVIGFSGILRPWHGLELLVEAFEALAREDDRLHLLIVGDGPIRPALEADLARRQLGDRVTVTGRLPHGVVRDHVGAMDIAVSPRATFYASPMKVVEYMAMGKAVVAPDMANLRDLLRDGATGLLFTPEDATALRRQLSRVIVDAPFRAELGRAAREAVVRARTWRHNASELIRLHATLSAKA